MKFYTNENLWAEDKNGNKCYIGDSIKDFYGNIGIIINKPKNNIPCLKVKFSFGEVPIYDVFYNPVEKIN